LVEGFDAVGQTMINFYKTLMGTQSHHRTPQFKFHPNCKSLGLTHLMFADDLMLFYKADPFSLSLLKGALHASYATVGLRANLHKSPIVIGGAS